MQKAHNRAERDGPLLSKEPSRDVHCLEGLLVSVLQLTPVFHPDIWIDQSVRLHAGCRIIFEDAPRDICINKTKFTLLTRCFFT